LGPIIDIKFYINDITWVKLGTAISKKKIFKEKLKLVSFKIGRLFNENTKILSFKFYFLI